MTGAKTQIGSAGPAIAGRGYGSFAGRIKTIVIFGSPATLTLQASNPGAQRVQSSNPGALQLQASNPGAMKVAT